MADFKELIDQIQSAVDNFNQNIPSVQEGIFKSLISELSALKTRSGNIVMSAENLRLVAKIKTRLLKIILNSDYIKNVKDYLKYFDIVTSLQNDYFKTLESNFTPPDLTKELQKQAIQSVTESLTERGIETNVIGAIESMLRTNITTGGSVADLHELLRNQLLNTDTGDGLLLRYSKQITTDALNQYSAQYTQVIASDLGLEWFRFSGSNIKTTRPWCIAMTKKKWVHISEFPAIIKGDFPEFKEANGKLYKGLPAGMIEGTNPSNLQINRGGYNCGHQLRPTSAAAVPEDVKQTIYLTPAYKQWKSAA